jgi:hypothetical protein
MGSGSATRVVDRTLETVRQAVRESDGDGMVLAAIATQLERFG